MGIARKKNCSDNGNSYVMRRSRQSSILGHALKQYGNGQKRGGSPVLSAMKTRLASGSGEKRKLFLPDAQSIFRLEGRPASSATALHNFFSVCFSCVTAMRYGKKSGRNEEKNQRKTDNNN